METLLLKVMSEGWLIYLLFFMIVWGFIWYGVPFIAKKFDDITMMFSKSLEDMLKSHRIDMDIIKEVFIAQIKESNLNHQITQAQIREFTVLHNDTHKKIDEIKDLLIKKEILCELMPKK